MKIFRAGALIVMHFLSQNSGAKRANREFGLPQQHAVQI